MIDPTIIPTSFFDTSFYTIQTQSSSVNLGQPINDFVNVIIDIACSAVPQIPPVLHLEQIQTTQDSAKTYVVGA